MKKGGFSSAALLLIALLWSSAVLIGYYYVHKPLSLQEASAFARVLIDLFAVAAFSGLAGGIGRRLLPGQEFKPLERFAIQAALGWGVMGAFWLGLGVLRLFSSISAWLTLALGWGLLRRHCVRWFREAGYLLSLWKSTGRFGRSLALGSGLLLAGQLLFALAPPVKWDTLVYHFDLPMRYLQAGQFYFVQNNPFWGHPQLGEMLFTWAIALRGTETAAVLNWCITVLFLLGILGITRHRAGNTGAWLAVTALTVSLSFRGMASWGYVDGLAALYGLGTLLLLLTPWEESDRKRPLWLGILTGLAVGVKLTAGILLPIVILVLLVPKRKARNRSFASISLFLVSVLLITAPWLLKNLIATGSPLYPHFFPTAWVDQVRQDFYSGGGTPLTWNTLWLPLALTWQGVEGAEGYAADLGPLLILFGLPGLLSRWKQQEGQIVGLWLLSGWLVIGLGRLYAEYLGQTRLYFVLLPAAGVAAGWGWQALKDITAAGVRLRRVLGIMILLALLLSLGQDLTWLVRANPAGVALGTRSRDQYLDDNLGWYAPAMRAVHQLSPHARTVLLWEPRGLYAPSEAQPDAWIDRWYIDRRQFGSPERILQAWQERGVTHLLLFEAGADFERQRRIEYEAADWLALDDLRSRLTPVDDFGGVYSLYSLPERP